MGSNLEIKLWKRSNMTNHNFLSCWVWNRKAIFFMLLDFSNLYVRWFNHYLWGFDEFSWIRGLGWKNDKSGSCFGILLDFNIWRCASFAFFLVPTDLYERSDHCIAVLEWVHYYFLLYRLGFSDWRWSIQGFFLSSSAKGSVNLVIKYFGRDTRVSGSQSFRIWILKWILTLDLGGTLGRKVLHTIVASYLLHDFLANNWRRLRHWFRGCIASCIRTAKALLARSLAAMGSVLLFVSRDH